MKQAYIASCVCKWENEDYAIRSEMSYEKADGIATTGKMETQIFSKKAGVGYRLNYEDNLNDLKYPEEYDVIEEDGEGGSESNKYFDLYVDDSHRNTFLLSVTADVLTAVLDCHHEAINGALAVVCGYIDWKLIKESE